MAEHYIEEVCKVCDLNSWEEIIYKQGDNDGIDKLADAIVFEFTECDKKCNIDANIKNKIKEIVKRIKEGK